MRNECTPGYLDVHHPVPYDAPSRPFLYMLPLPNEFALTSHHPVPCTISPLLYTIHAGEESWSCGSPKTVTDFEHSGAGLSVAYAAAHALISPNAAQVIAKQCSDRVIGEYYQECYYETKAPPKYVLDKTNTHNGMHCRFD